MSNPNDLFYTNDHEWVRLDADVATVGITDFAQSELGDIIFVEFPDVGASFRQGDTFGTVEAVKTVADLYMPMSGEIVALNDGLENNPEAVNRDPYDTGWLVKIKLSAAEESASLMDSAAYEKIIA